MPAPQVRAVYDQLKDAAKRFDGQAQATQKTLQSLQRELDVLQGGDWVGTGASSFYQEMGGQVLPTLKRLATALASAQQTTLQIQQVMAQAEAEAARWLRGEGEGPNAALGGEAAVGVAGGSALLGGTAGSAGAAGGAPIARPAPAPRPGADLAGGARQFDAAVAKILAEENAAVDNKLAQFSPGVRAIVKQSPTLRAQILKMQQLGFNVHIVPEGGATSTSWAEQKITIEQPRSDAEAVADLAHEVGHAVNKPGEVTLFEDSTRDEYVKPSVEIMLRNEGQAAFNEAQVQAELIAAGGPDISVGQAPAYRQAYADYQAGNITREQALARMTTLMAKETPSVALGPGRPKLTFATYREMYTYHYNYIYDTNIDVPRRR